jgi:hypothetical protein
MPIFDLDDEPDDDEDDEFGGEDDEDDDEEDDDGEEEPETWQVARWLSALRQARPSLDFRF